MESMLSCPITKSKNDLELLALHKINAIEVTTPFLAPPGATAVAAGDESASDGDGAEEGELTIRCPGDEQRAHAMTQTSVMSSPPSSPRRPRPHLYSITSYDPAPAASPLRQLRDSCDLLLVGGACVLIIEIIVLLIMAFRGHLEANGGKNSFISALYRGVPDTVMFPIIDGVLVFIALMQVASGVVAAVTHRRRKTRLVRATRVVAAVAAATCCVGALLLLHRIVILAMGALWLFLAVVIVEELFVIMAIAGGVIVAVTAGKLAFIMQGITEVTLKET